MTIHHDKMAYGKLDNLSEKFSEDKLRKMAELLSENGGGQSEEDLEDESKTVNRGRQPLHGSVNEKT